MYNSLVFPYSLLVIKCVLLISLNESKAFMMEHNPHYRSEFLDKDQGTNKFLLEWMVDFDSKRVTFNITVQTIHWLEK